MDKELLKQYNLEGAQKRFQQICEYTFITSPMLAEDGEDEENIEDGNGDAPTPENNGGEETDGLQPPPQHGENDGMEGENDEMSDDSEGDAPVPDDNGGETEDFDIEPEQSDDEVIDVDDLTKSQEASEYKIDGVDEKLTTLLNVVSKFGAAIEMNDKKIDDLKAEIERRNPTEEEILNLRSLNAYPYSVKPNDYWKGKENDPNYRIEKDNEVNPNDEIYKFTKKDLKTTDDRTISDSFENYNKLSDYIDFD